jgi:hypothetical protein
MNECIHIGMRLKDGYRCYKTGYRIDGRDCHKPGCFEPAIGEDLTLDLEEEAGGQLEIF